MRVPLTLDASPTKILVISMFNTCSHGSNGHGGGSSSPPSSSGDGSPSASFSSTSSSDGSFDRADLIGSAEPAAPSNSARLDTFLSVPTKLTNTLFSAASVLAGTSLRQVQCFIDAVSHPGFVPEHLLGSAAAVARRVDHAKSVFEQDDTLHLRILIPHADLVLPLGVRSDPFLIAFDVAKLLTAVLRNPSVTHARRLTLDASGSEPSGLPGGAPVAEGSACFSKLGKAMFKAIRALHESSREPVAALLCTLQIDKGRASRFGNVLLCPVVLIILSLLRPYRYKKEAVITIAYLPIVCSADEDKPAAREGSATLFQRSLTLGVVKPLDKLWRTGFVVDGIPGFHSPVRVVPGIHVVSSDHAGNVEVGNVNRHSCVECTSRKEDVGFFDPHTTHSPRLLAAATAARAAAVTAPTIKAKAEVLSALALHAGAPCAFDAWTLPGSMWAGDPYGFAKRSSLCFMHHFLEGYFKWNVGGFNTVFGACKNFTSPQAWRASQEVWVRFIQSQPCFSTGNGQQRILSLTHFQDMTWWSADSRFSSLVMTVAALHAVQWPFSNPTLQSRLLDVGERVLQMWFLGGAIQYPAGHSAKLQNCVESVHAAFDSVAVEFEFSLEGKIKPHNAVVHMVSSTRRIGVPAEFNGGPGVESVHPYGKRVHEGSNKKGEIQDVAAAAHDRRHFVQSELVPALARARCDETAGSVDEDDEDSLEGGRTCAYATGILFQSMNIAEVPGLPGEGLVALIKALFPPFCATIADLPLASPLRTKSFSQWRCYVRRSIKLCRRNVVSRILQVVPDSMTGIPHSLLHPCVQLFRNDGYGGVKPDPRRFCEPLLVFSYDIRPGYQARMTERAVRDSKADATEDIVLVRMLKYESHTDGFVRCSIPGPALHKVTPAGFKHFQLLPVSAFAQPRAAFPAFKGGLNRVPEGDLTPWCGSDVNIFLLL